MSNANMCPIKHPKHGDVDLFIEHTGSMIGQPSLTFSILDRSGKTIESWDYFPMGNTEKQLREAVQIIKDLRTAIGCTDDPYGPGGGLDYRVREEYKDSKEWLQKNGYE